MGPPEARTQPGRIFWLIVDISLDDVNWQNLGAVDFDGPWRNKQGVLQNNIGVSFGLPRTSEAGWRVRVNFRVENGPIDIAGGSLVLI